jgi:hypothetical protein
VTGAAGVGSGTRATVAGRSLGSGVGAGASRGAGGGGGGLAMAAFLWHPDIIARADIPIVNINNLDLISVPLLPF